MLIKGFIVASLGLVFLWSPNLEAADDSIYQMQIQEYSRFHQELAERQRGEMAEQTQYIQELAQKKTSLEQESQALEKQISGLNQTVERQQEQVGELQEKNALLMEKYLKLQGEFENLEALYQRQLQDEAVLEKELGQAPVAVEKTPEAQDDLKERNTQLQNEIKALIRNDDVSPLAEEEESGPASVDEDSSASESVPAMSEPPSADETLIEDDTAGSESSTEDVNEEGVDEPEGERILIQQDRI